MSLLFVLLYSMPIWILFGAGICFAAIRWSRHPRVSMLVIVALAGMLALDVFGTLVSQLLFGANGIPMSTQLVSTGFYGLQSLVDAALFGVLIAAFMVGRVRWT